MSKLKLSPVITAVVVSAVLLAGFLVVWFLRFTPKPSSGLDNQPAVDWRANQDLTPPKANRSPRLEPPQKIDATLTISGVPEIYVVAGNSIGVSIDGIQVHSVDLSGDADLSAIPLGSIGRDVAKLSVMHYSTLGPERVLLAQCTGSIDKTRSTPTRRVFTAAFLVGSMQFTAPVENGSIVPMLAEVHLVEETTTNLRLISRVSLTAEVTKISRKFYPGKYRITAIIEGAPTEVEKLTPAEIYDTQPAPRQSTENLATNDVIELKFSLNRVPRWTLVRFEGSRTIRKVFGCNQLGPAELSSAARTGGKREPKAGFTVRRELFELRMSETSPQYAKTVATGSGRMGWWWYDATSLYMRTPADSDFDSAAVVYFDDDCISLIGTEQSRQLALTRTVSVESCGTPARIILSPPDQQFGFVETGHLSMRLRSAETEGQEWVMTYDIDRNGHIDVWGLPPKGHAIIANDPAWSNIAATLVPPEAESVDDALLAIGRFYPGEHKYCQLYKSR